MPFFKKKRSLRKRGGRKRPSRMRRRFRRGIKRGALSHMRNPAQRQPMPDAFHTKFVYSLNKSIVAGAASSASQPIIIYPYRPLANAPASDTTNCYGWNSLVATVDTGAPYVFFLPTYVKLKVNLAQASGSANVFEYAIATWDGTEGTEPTLNDVYHLQHASTITVANSNNPRTLTKTFKTPLHAIHGLTRRQYLDQADTYRGVGSSYPSKYAGLVLMVNSQEGANLNINVRYDLEIYGYCQMFNSEGETS